MTDTELIEVMARAIFEHWEFQPVKAPPVAWVPGGNSMKQDTARAYAREALAVVRAHDGAELAAARADMDAAEARAEASHDECEYAQDLVIRQGNLLRAVVNALRGPPPEDMHWSVHDAADLAIAMRDRAERAEAEAARLRAALKKAPHDPLCAVIGYLAPCNCWKRAALAQEGCTTDKAAQFFDGRPDGHHGEESPLKWEGGR